VFRASFIENIRNLQNEIDQGLPKAEKTRKNSARLQVIQENINDQALIQSLNLLFLSNQDQNSLPNEKENATLNTFYKSILQ
jgi:hypothetical protein